MKQGILLLLFIAFFCNAHAQDSSIFKLKDYKYRTPGYRALELSLNTSGGFQNIRYPNINDQGSHFELSPSSIQYYSVVSTDRKQTTHSFGITPYYYGDKNKDNDVKSWSRNIQSGLSWSMNNRYFNNGNNFFEWGNDLFNSFGQSRNKTPNTRSEYNYNSLRNNFYLGFGRGRIENVQDAQMALFIINDLEHHGLLNKLAEGKTINDFAKLLTDLNNRRIFDFRRRRIFELTQIDNFLREKGLVTVTDIRHFTIINDNWALAFNPFRRSGTNWYVRMQAQGGYDYTFQDTKSVNNYTVENRYPFLELGPKLGFEKYVPVSLKWQKNMGASITGFWINSRNRSESIYNGTVNNLARDTFQFFRTGLSVYYGVGYFPNNRTILTAEINLSSFNDWGDDNNPQKYLSALRPAFLMNADYFLGYRTRLQANLNLFYEKRYEKDLKLLDGRIINGSFSISLKHTIF